MSDSDFLAARLLFDRPVAAETLAEWTAQAAQPKPEPQAAQASALLVRAGAEWFGLPAPLVETALTAGPIHSLPFLSGEVFLGLANVDGELLPCVDLRALAGAAPLEEPTGAPLLVVLTTDGGRFALRVDQALGTCPYDPHALAPLPDTLTLSGRALASGLARLEGHPAALLDPRALGAALARSLRP